ncbi:T9SS sorting signal type C domain-containing protein [Flavobacterium bizetiae]|uniref:T9SS sorting signal type C domain-containing protein n=1 Tax=Flavobacterium bizetiae TaxID=2704140 RepID=UPI0021E8E2DF|nr:T9SS sorting signal type C domain-containing protein [Flavobacterium bizetiae]UTN05087.1 T9SS sorting signal type C domain-containing protein [Flavobacterium bizetiae]
MCCLYNAKFYAQQGKVDITFNALDDGQSGDGFDSTVRTLSLQPDQKLIVGGEYLSLNGIPSSYLTRLHSNGMIDESFDTGTSFNGKIYASYIQSDGKIIVGGNFTTYNGIVSGRLIRLNTDGSYDNTFNTSVAANGGIIYEICPQTDGKIIIVGSFTKYNNVTVNRIARILPDGSLDSSFVTGSGSSSNITNVKVLPNGKIVLAGNFEKFSGVPANKIVCLFPDGSVDRSFDAGTGFDADVNAMTVQADGKIILGGKFTNYNGNIANRIIRINQDASIDHDFLSGSGFNGDAVQVVKIDPLGNIMVAGSFIGSYNGQVVNRVCFLNSDGTLKTDFDIGSGPKSASVFTLENDVEGSWYIGGSFSIFDGLNQGRLAKISSDGEYDTSYLSAGIGFDGSVLKVLPLENKKTMVFGNFTRFNGTFSSRITRVLDDGLYDAAFNEGQSGANNLIKAAVLQSDGKIIFGGNFTKYNETASNRISRILPDGEIDNTFNIGAGFNGLVYAIVTQEDGKVIVGGSFTKYNGASAIRIVRLLQNGLLDATFNVGIGADAVVEALLVQPDGKILVAGRFNSFDGRLSSRLIRLNSNGSIDSDFNIGVGFDGHVYAIALQSDNKIILGGTFLTYNGISQKRIIRLNSDGSLDTTFESGTGFSKGEVRCLLVQPDDRILVGGTFSGTYKTNNALRLIRLVKSGDYDSSFETQLNNKIYAMSFANDYKLIIGGDFNSISGISKHRIARLKLCLEATIWNGNSWTNGFPSGGKELVFKDDYYDLTTSNVCSCKIDEGKTVTLLSENTLGISFDYSGLGTLVLNDRASLYQDDDEMINSGIVYVKRKSSPILKSDYTYWSSPVENQKLIDVSPNTIANKFFSYDAVFKNWKQENPVSSSMDLGKGYIIMAPDDFSNALTEKFEAIFKGIPNNGKVSVDLGSENSFNLIGNPYPSAINADIFLSKNTSNIKGALYFWTHNTPITNHKYNVNDYAAYNLLGGVGTRATALGLNETTPDGTVASGQGFFVKNKNSGFVEFNNSMRIAGRNSIFFKPENNTLKTNKSTFERHRIWLNFENKEGAFKQILLGYIQGATNFYDESFDAETFNGNAYVDFYSLNDAKKLVIQGRALPFTITDTIPLAYRTTIADDFTISIDHADGDLSNQDIYLEDKITGIVHDLTKSNYTFTTSAGTFIDRFILRYTNKTLEIKDFENPEMDILVSVKNKIIDVLSSKENIQEVVVFDILGKVVYHKKKIDANALKISNLQSGNQVLLVKVTLENENIISKKIIF